MSMESGTRKLRQKESGSPCKRLKSESGSRWEVLKESGSGGKRVSLFGGQQVPLGEYPWDTSSYHPVIQDFIKVSYKLVDSEYDAISHPSIPHHRLQPLSDLTGGIVPHKITDDNRPTLISRSKFALKYYNQKNNQAFVFHQLVKCTIGGARGCGDLHYITFQAKEEEDPFKQKPDITTFQAKVWKRWDAEEPQVRECRIKI